MFEAVEASFDAVALFIELFVVGAGLFPVPPWRYDRDRSEAFDLGNDLGRVVPLVGDDSFGLAPFQQADGLSVLGSLTCCDAEVYWQPGFVGQQMDLGAQSTSGTPQSRVFRAPFL